jgi:hypothetical protein
MKEYNLQIKSDLNERENHIINDYWVFLDGKFINGQKSIIQKYKIKSNELYKIIKENSTCKIIYGKCIDCGTNIEESVNNQKEFKEAQSMEIDRCSLCRDTMRMNEIKEQLANAKREKRWNQLSYKEFDVFTMCIKYDRPIVFSKIKSKYPDHNFKEINKLEDIDLIYLIKDNDNHIIKILVPEGIENEQFEEMYCRKKIDDLTIELEKTKNENLKLNYLSVVIDKGALETIKGLAAENALLKQKIAELKGEK